MSSIDLAFANIKPFVLLPPGETQAKFWLIKCFFDDVESNGIPTKGDIYMGITRELQAALTEVIGERLSNKAIVGIVEGLPREVEAELESEIRDLSNRAAQYLESLIIKVQQDQDSEGPERLTSEETLEIGGLNCRVAWHAPKLLTNSKCSYFRILVTSSVFDEPCYFVRSTLTGVLSMAIFNLMDSLDQKARGGNGYRMGKRRPVEVDEYFSGLISRWSG